MAEKNVDFELMMRLLKENRNDIKEMSSRMAEGFASMRSHQHTIHTDIYHHERRIAELESEVERLKTAIGVNQEPEK